MNSVLTLFSSYIVYNTSIKDNVVGCQLPIYDVVEKDNVESLVSPTTNLFSFCFFFLNALKMQDAIYEEPAIIVLSWQEYRGKLIVLLSRPQ